MHMLAQTIKIKSFPHVQYKMQRQQQQQHRPRGHAGQRSAVGQRKAQKHWPAHPESRRACFKCLLPDKESQKHHSWPAGCARGGKSTASSQTLAGRGVNSPKYCPARPQTPTTAMCVHARTKSDPNRANLTMSEWQQQSCSRALPRRRVTENSETNRTFTTQRSILKYWKPLQSSREHKSK